MTGTLILDGQGNANAAWVFLMDSSLITSPDSVVKVIHTGAGAGVYWDVRSSATIDTNDNCGRALASTAAVTLQMNTLSIGCSAAA